MTKLKFWFQSQTPTERKKFIDNVIDCTGISSRKTIYNYLNTEPPKLTKQLICSFTNIPIYEMYEQVKTL